MTEYSKDQHGFAVIELVLFGVLAVIIIGTGWFVWHSKQVSDKNLAPTSQTTPSFKKKDSTKKSTDASSTTPTTTTPTTPTTPKTTTKTSTSSSGSNGSSTPQPRTIQFVNGGQEQVAGAGSPIAIDAYLSEAQTGTCTYTFYIDGSQALQEDSAINSSNHCHILIDASDFPKSGTYTYKLNFTSQDGMVIASSANAGSIDVEQ